MGQPRGWVWGAVPSIVLLCACAEDAQVGPGMACGEPPTFIEALVGDVATTEGIPDQLDVSACREGRMVETLSLGSAWVELRRVNGCCEVWLGGETEDPSYDGSPQQFCRFSRATGERVPIYVGRRPSSVIGSAGPARTCEDTPACTVGLPPTYPCGEP